MSIATSEAEHSFQAQRWLDYLPGAILFIFALLTLGVFDPHLNAVNFDQLTLQTAIQQTSTPNPYNQLRWAALAVLASVLVVRMPHRLVEMSIALPFVLLLLAFCATSALWSQFPVVSLRRAAGLIVCAYCLLVAVTYIERVERACVLVYAAFWVALALNVAVLGRGSAYDELGFFRGITENKNTLGSIAALAILFGLVVGPWLRSAYALPMRLAFLAAWAGLLVLSMSKTSLGLVVVVPLGFLTLKAISGMLRLSLGFAGLGSLAFVSLLLAIGHYGAGYTPQEFAQLLLSNTTLTERTPIWAFVLREIGGNWLVGSGFGSFWGVGFSGPSLKALHQYVRLINQAHNGYIDVLATLGAAGLVLLALVIVAFARATEKLRTTQGALFALLWFVMLFSLLHNITESSLLVPFNVVWHLTLFALFVCARGRDET